MLRIIRDSGYADKIRKYKVIVNDSCIGEVGNGETVEFEVATGKHEVYLKIDWCRSNMVAIEVNDGQTVELFGGSSLRGAKIFLAILYITFLSKKYLWLTDTRP